MIEQDVAALVANDIRVLVDDLNRRLREAADAGLNVEIETTRVLRMRPSVVGFTQVRVLGIQQDVR